MRTSELDYHLPPERIATEPAEPRDSARLLVVDRARNRLYHHQVRDLLSVPNGPRAGDLMLFNHTKVLPASFEAVRTATGGGVGGLYVRSPGEKQWELMLESRGKLQAGETVTLTADAQLRLLEPQGGGQWLAQLESERTTLSILEEIGSPPLPPYIKKARKSRGEDELRPEDRQRYNTVFADQPGSVAAPTASLHFTPQLLAQLDQAGVERAALTLHVGLGTFLPVRSETLDEHPMHSEWFSLPQATLRAIRETRKRGGRIIPVGTTCVRSVESLPDPLPDPAALPEGYAAQTNLFIRPADGEHPGFTFRYTDALMTNFHLPRSTLLALVAALPGVGVDRLKAWYATAVEERYRFYSYGDAMWLG